MMSNIIQKTAYVTIALALVATALFGLATVASAQVGYDEGYWDGVYYDYGDYYDGYGGYNDYGSYDPYDYNGYTYDTYDPYYDYDYNDYYGYDNCYDCYGSSYGYNDYYAYDYGDCYYYDCYDDYYYDDYCYDCYDYDYDNYCYYYDCSGGSGNIAIDIWNNNVNTNTNTNTNTNVVYSYNDNDDDDEDEDDDIDFDVICIPSDDEVEEGDRVTFRARVFGVSASRVDFEWSGDVDGDDEEVSKRFNREGTYRARVTAEYRGQVESDTCTVDVEEEDDDRDRDRDRNRVSLVSTPPTGTPASGVYLSQVPYTGVADNMKLIGFLTMLTLASLVGAYYVVTRKARADRKSFIERFKQENLASKVN